MAKAKRTVVQGWDVSLNHAAMVELTDGKLTDFRYVTDKAGDAAASKKRGARINVDRMRNAHGKDRHRWMMARLLEMTNHLRAWASSMPEFVGVEDYAIGAEQGAHYLGEIGGQARKVLWELGIPFRLHDPTSVKMFVTHDGTAPKEEIQLSVLERWGVDFSQFNKVKGEQTSEDLADAFGIAMMVWMEVQLRRGIIRLSDFHEKEIRVFNRVTKTNPVSLLERDWVSKVTLHG
jgi:Holliday junction resolvasome RuvABC endonuclease subunit